MGTSPQFSRLAKPFVTAASRLAAVPAAQRRLLVSLLLAVGTVLIGSPWQPGATPLQALSADGVDEAGSASDDLGDLPPPPPSDDTPPSAGAPLEIENLTASNVFDDLWIIEGLVVGSIPLEGLTVVLGGLATGETTTVTSDDTFLIIMSIAPNVEGDISAVVEGPDGIDSPMAIVPIDGNVSVGGA
jgi:hypothetical protein